MGFFSRVRIWSVARRTCRWKHVAKAAYVTMPTVPSLKQDYQNLLGIYGEVSRAAADFALIWSNPAHDPHNLQTHQLKMYVYVYRSNILPAIRMPPPHRRPAQGDGWHRPRAVQFVNRMKPPNSPRISRNLPQGTGGHRGSSVKRISTEESRLYTLYMPSY